jgi:hypothetical protein
MKTKPTLVFIASQNGNDDHGNFGLNTSRRSLIFLFTRNLLNNERALGVPVTRTTFPPHRVHLPRSISRPDAILPETLSMEDISLQWLHQVLFKSQAWTSSVYDSQIFLALGVKAPCIFLPS